MAKKSNEVEVVRPIPEPVKNSLKILGDELANPEKLAKLRTEREGLKKEIEELDEKLDGLKARERAVRDEIDRMEETIKTLKELEEQAAEA